MIDLQIIFHVLFNIVEAAFLAYCSIQTDGLAIVEIDA